MTGDINHPSVRGHLCDGLKELQDARTYGCIPNFTDSGYLQGCDDTNYTKILYCPMCGVKLNEQR